MKSLLAVALISVALGLLVPSNAAGLDAETISKLTHRNGEDPEQIKTASLTWCVALQNEKGEQKTIQLEMYQQRMIWADPQWDVQAYVKDGFATQSYTRGPCPKKVEIVRQYLGAEKGDVPGTCTCVGIKRDESGVTRDTIDFYTARTCGVKACNELCQWKHSSLSPKNYTGLRAKYRWGGGKCVP